MCIAPTIASYMNVECCGIPNANTNQCMCACTGTVNKAGDTPLSLACANGHLDTVKYLVNEHHCDPRSKLSLYMHVYYTKYIICSCCIHVAILSVGAYLVLATIQMHYNEPIMHACGLPQSQSTRLVTLHSLWPTKPDT